MTFTNELHGYETGIVRRMRATLELARANHTKRRDYNRTYAELSKLSARELDDLGIHRENIAAVAREAAYGN